MSVHRDEVKPVQAKLDGNGGKVDMLKAALWYAHLGLPVVPLHTPTADGCSCGNADCSSVGKHPRTYNGVRAATTDQTTIQRWWKRWPRANIGIAIDGELAVVDIDGAASWDWLRGQHLPESPRVLTGGGNLHIYIKAPPQTVGDIVLWSDGQGSEVRLKGVGGYAVAPPSLHSSGERYEFAPFLGLGEVGLASRPGCIQQRIEAKKAPVEVDAEDVNFTLCPDAEPPQELFDQLFESSKQFRLTWHRDRADLDDQSPSGYDMSLANQAVDAGWSDQEFVDLLIAHRREHGNPPKLRVDYYGRTLAKTRARKRVAPEHEREIFADYLQDRGVQGSSGVVRADCLLCGGGDALRVDFDRCHWCCSSCYEGGGTPELVEACQELDRKAAEQREMQRRRKHPFVPRGQEKTPCDDYGDLEHNEEHHHAIVEGWQLIRDADPSESDWRTGQHTQVRDFIDRTLGHYERCMQDAYFRKYHHKKHGPSYQPAYVPCRALAHEHCIWEHAVSDDELGARGENFAHHYGDSQLAVLTFIAPDAGPKGAKEMVTKLKNLESLRELFTGTRGYMRATSEGYAFDVLVRVEDLADNLPRAEEMWKKYTRLLGRVEVELVDPYYTPLEACAELKCRAEQAIPLLVGELKLDPVVALEWLSEELRLQDRCGQNRVVDGPGFLTLPEDSQDMEEGAIGSKRVLSLDPTEGFDSEWKPCKVCDDPDCGQRPDHHAAHLSYHAVQERIREDNWIRMFVGGVRESPLGVMPIYPVSCTLGMQLPRSS